MSFSFPPLHFGLGAFVRTLTRNQVQLEIQLYCHNVNKKYINIFYIYSVSMGLASRGDFSGAKNRSWAGPLARLPKPEKPRFWACQKVVPPPCKNVQKCAFLGEKACIFGQFVHNFAQKWPLFCGHSPPATGLPVRREKTRQFIQY